MALWKDQSAAQRQRSEERVMREVARVSRYAREEVRKGQLLASTSCSHGASIEDVFGWDGRPKEVKEQVDPDAQLDSSREQLQQRRPKEVKEQVDPDAQLDSSREQLQQRRPKEVKEQVDPDAQLDSSREQLQQPPERQLQQPPRGRERRPQRQMVGEAGGPLVEPLKKTSWDAVERKPQQAADVQERPADSVSKKALEPQTMSSLADTDSAAQVAEPAATTLMPLPEVMKFPWEFPLGIPKTPWSALQNRVLLNAEKQQQQQQSILSLMQADEDALAYRGPSRMSSAAAVSSMSPDGKVAVAERLAAAVTDHLRESALAEYQRVCSPPDFPTVSERLAAAPSPQSRNSSFPLDAMLVDRQRSGTSVGSAVTAENSSVPTSPGYARCFGATGLALSNRLATMSAPQIAPVPEYLGTSNISTAAIPEASGELWSRLSQLSNRDRDELQKPGLPLHVKEAFATACELSMQLTVETAAVASSREELQALMLDRNAAQAEVRELRVSESVNEGRLSSALHSEEAACMELPLLKEQLQNSELQQSASREGYRQAQGVLEDAAVQSRDALIEARRVAAAEVACLFEVTSMNQARIAALDEMCTLRARLRVAECSGANRALYSEVRDEAEAARRWSEKVWELRSAEAAAAEAASEAEARSDARIAQLQKQLDIS